MKKKVIVLVFTLLFNHICFSQIGKYRNNQKYLFQNVPYKEIPNRIIGGSPFYFDNFGPTHKFVDLHSGWRWANLGGDWIDSNLVSQGPKPWFSIPVDSVVPLNQPVSYQGDVTDAIKYVYINDTWNAFLFKNKNAERAIATPFDSNNNPPKIIVTYTNSTKDTLMCRIVGGHSAATLLPITTFPKVGLSAFVEFDKPILPVQSATLFFDIVEHWSGANARLEGYLLNPPTNVNPVEYGVAQNAGLLDLNIASQPGVLGAHRYLDNTSWSDFSNSGGYNTHLETSFDPAIYGTGTQDLSKLPHFQLGKWINVSSDMSKVSSNYTGEGFVPLAPDLGALRVRMDSIPINDGGVINYGGTASCDANIYLPDSLDGQPCFGELDHIFVRYYFRLGDLTNLSPKNRKQFYYTNVGGSTNWATMAGKWGIVPDHSTSYGGYSGSSGGGFGWQMRNSWYECDAGLDGPSEGGWAVGYHMYDFYYQNPAGHNYGGSDPNPGGSELWGQKGGMNLFYSNKWYCVESELKLNTITAAAPGYIADGYQKTWIDGKLAYESTGMVFRTEPNVYPPDVLYLRPVRSLGIRNIKLNWFHGGKTPATIDRTTFYTGLVWSKNYIGPMNLNNPSAIENDEFDSNLTGIKTFPNPVDNILNIQFPSNSNLCEVSIFDIGGKLVFHQKINLHQQTRLLKVPMSTWTNGIYILQTNLDGKITNTKICK